MGIAWTIRETSVGKEIRQQVRSVPKNLPLQSDRKVDKWGEFNSEDEILKNVTPTVVVNGNLISFGTKPRIGTSSKRIYLS